ncbi:hypothetical protein LguiA_033121 [Lonicera macranthoides]
MSQRRVKEFQYASSATELNEAKVKFQQVQQTCIVTVENVAALLMKVTGSIGEIITVTESNVEIRQQDTDSVLKFEMYCDSYSYENVLQD